MCQLCIISHQLCINSLCLKRHKVDTQMSYNKVATELIQLWVITKLLRSWYNVVYQLWMNSVHISHESWYEVDTPQSWNKMILCWFKNMYQLCINFVSTLYKVVYQLYINFARLIQSWYRVDTVPVCINSESTFQESWYTTELKQSCTNFCWLCINFVSTLCQLFTKLFINFISTSQSWYTTELIQSCVST